MLKRNKFLGSLYFLAPGPLLWPQPWLMPRFQPLALAPNLYLPALVPKLYLATLARAIATFHTQGPGN